MLQSPSSIKKNSILKSIISGGNWANQIGDNVDALQLMGDIILLGEFSMESLSKSCDIHDHSLYDKGSKLGVFIARMWTEMRDDGIGAFLAEGCLDSEISPISSQVIEDGDGVRVGTIISMNHSGGVLFVAVEMVGDDLSILSEENLLWPEMIVRSARCPRCGSSASNEMEICQHMARGVIPIVNGYAERLVLRKDRPERTPLQEMFAEKEDFIDLLQPETLSRRNISSEIELFRFIVTDDVGDDLLKIGPYFCAPGRELLLSKEEVERWIDPEDYEEGYIFFLGTMNGDMSKAQVEMMIGSGIKKESAIEYDGSKGFEFPE